MSEQEKTEKKVEQVKGDKPKKVEQAKSSEQIKKARPVIKVELKKDEPKKNELKKNIQVKSAEQTPKIESIKKVELKKDESRENKQVKSAEQTPKVESIKKVELKKDESRENKQVKSAEQTPKVESIKKVELKKDESKENEQVKLAEQAKQSEEKLAKKAEQDKLVLLSQKKGQFHSIGRRKNALARVYIQTGGGNFFVNKRELKNYFVLASFARTALMPLELVKFRKKINVKAFVKGGGVSGQAGAIKLGLSRALLKFNPEWKTKFRSEGFLTRDSRAVERKKYGQKGARAKFQYSKR